MITPDDIQKIIGPEGVIAGTFSEYEHRREQIRMSLETADAFNNNDILLAEAGTGIGKTMAYLAPVFYLAGEGVTSIISTYTINLQSQLINKDIPAVFRNSGITYTLVKGRGNYVCRSEVDYASGSIIMHDDPYFKRFLDWLKKTSKGDREDLDFDFPYWLDVRSDAHTCRKEDCPYYQSDTCYYYNMRKRAENSQVIVTNHALFFSDLAVKLSGEKPSGGFDDADLNLYAGILPDYSAVIFDEAHHLEDVAGNVFGSEITNGSVPFLIKRLRNRKYPELPDSLLKAAEECSDSLFNSIDTKKNDYFISDISNDDLLGSAKELSEKLGVIAEELSEAKTASDDKEAKNHISSLIDMVSETIYDVNEIFFNDSEAYFRWGEQKTNERYSLKAFRSTPVSVSGILCDNLFARDDISFVLTSATLKSNDNFDFIKNRLGIDSAADDGRVKESEFESPFKYKEQMLLYVPKDTPEPNDSAEYAEVLTEQIRSLIRITGGGAFILFTSYSMLNKVYSLLADTEGFVFLRQGEKSNAVLLEEFKEKPDACLLGTSSFWEGVDIPGAQLRLVIMDKIPFSVPTNPAVIAKSEYLRSLGKHPFMDYVLPEAIIRLKQGMGRLIRTKNDRGIIAVLDSRLHNKAYRKEIFRSLPRCKGVTDLEKVREWADARLDMKAAGKAGNLNKTKGDTESTPKKTDKIKYMPDMSKEEKAAYFKKINAIKKAKKRKAEKENLLLK